MLELVLAFLGSLLRAFLPAIIEAAPDRPEDGQEQPAVRDALRAKIARTWGTAAVLLLICAIAGGCFSRVVYVKAGEPVRLRQTLHHVGIWAMGADGKPVAGTIDLPEGWYCLPMDPARDAAVPVLRDSEVK